MTEVYLSFSEVHYLALHILRASHTYLAANVLTKFLGKFTKASVLSCCLNKDTLLSVYYKATSNQLTNKDV